jgi:hypothetical protein
MPKMYLNVPKIPTFDQIYHSTFSAKKAAQKFGQLV